MDSDNAISMTDSVDEDADILAGPPIFRRTTPASKPPRAAALQKKPAPPAAHPPPTKKMKKSVAKKRKCDMPHCLIWICHHGKGEKRSWTRDALHLVGVYATKQAALDARDEMMSKLQCAGHGDICVGDFWSDEIDLVIREAPMFFSTEE